MLRLDFSVSDLLNTSVHFPNEPSATGLEFFTDGHYTASRLSEAAKSRYLAKFRDRLRAIAQ